MSKLSNKIKHAWDAFNGKQEVPPEDYSYGMSYGYKPDRPRLFFSNEQSIISSIYNKLAIDVADNPIRNVRVDGNDRYLEDVDSGLNYCLTSKPNLDQEPRSFRQDIAMTLFDKGVAAVVPVITSVNPNLSSSFEIKDMRVGHILTWYPKHVQVRLYNEKTGNKEDIIVQKKFVAIIENPFYSIMNEPNSTLQRLIRKLNLLDNVDEEIASGKLDIIIQLPYTVKSEARRQQAAQRREDIEFQLRGSKYGIAYLDATEKVTQLNRPAENNLLAQIEFLTQSLYTQLGLTPEIMNSTADEKSMISYRNRTIKPIMDAITEAMTSAFLTKTAQSQGQRVTYFTDPFSLVPISDISEIADKFTRNEIMTSNEIRQIMGIKPAKDPKADELRNSNMPADKDVATPQESDTDLASQALDEVEKTVNEALSEFGGGT